MKTEDFKNLEQVYESINKKETQLISEDANETLGAALVYVVAFGLPFVFEGLSRLYPEIKNKLNEAKQNKQLVTKLQSVLQSKKEEPPKDKLASMLSRRVKTPTGFRG
jgi:dsRNA-specific ribonuclease